MFFLLTLCNCTDVIVQSIWFLDVIEPLFGIDVIMPILCCTGVIVHWM